MTGIHKAEQVEQGKNIAFKSILRLKVVLHIY